MPIAVGIEEAGADVLRQAVSGNGGLSRRTERPVALLNEQLARLPLGAADVQIVEAVAVHIADCEARPLRRKEMRYQRLAGVVEESVFDMPEIQTRLPCRVGKKL